MLQIYVKTLYVYTLIVKVFNVFVLKLIRILSGNLSNQPWSAFT